MGYHIGELFRGEVVFRQYDAVGTGVGHPVLESRVHPDEQDFRGALPVDAPEKSVQARDQRPQLPSLLFGPNQDRTLHELQEPALIHLVAGPELGRALERAHGPNVLVPGAEDRAAFGGRCERVRRAGGIVCGLRKASMRGAADTQEENQETERPGRAPAVTSSAPHECCPPSAPPPASRPPEYRGSPPRAPGRS